MTENRRFHLLRENDIVGRYEVPADDRWHRYQLSGPVLHVAARTPNTVEFWATVDSHAALTATRHFRVFGTGQPLPGDVVHVGTALAAGGRLVWHLMEDVSR